MSIVECAGCGLAAMDLPDDFDPEVVFEVGENGVIWCRGCQQTAPVVRRCPACSTLTGSSGVCPACGWWPR